MKSERFLQAAPHFAEVFRSVELPLVRVQLEPAPPGFEAEQGVEAVVRAQLRDRQTGASAGKLSRQLCEKDDELYVQHHRLALLSNYRRRDIGKTLERQALPRYRELGVTHIKIAPTGEGSVVSARAGYVLDLARTRRRGDPTEVSQNELRARAIEDLVRCPGLNEPHPVDPALPPTTIEGPQVLLDRVRQASPEGARRVAEFYERMPTAESLSDPSSHAFREPADIVAFAYEEELEGLAPDEWLGEGVARRSRWLGIKRL